MLFDSKPQLLNRAAVFSRRPYYFLRRRASGAYIKFSLQPSFPLFRLMYPILTTVLRRPPVAVYQIGRVSSSAVTEAARRRLAGLVFHTHCLAENFVAEKSSEGRVMTPNLRRYARQNDAVARCIHWALNHGQVHFIVLVREPVGHSLSEFFYKFTWDRTQSLDAEDWTIESLRRRYEADYLRLPLNRFETWFDEELRCHTGFDVFTQAFDRARGWQVYSYQKHKFLVLKLETPRAVKDAALGSFLHLKAFSLHATNTGEDQAYADLYRRFRESFSLSPAEADAIYGGRFAQHFYSPVEIEGFKARWVVQ